MDFEQARQQVEQWIVDFVEKPTPLLNGWPPCPYARRARLDQKVQLRPGVADPYSDCELCEMSGLDVIGYIYDPKLFTADQFNRQIAAANRDFLQQRDMIALADHPSDREEVNGVCMNQGTWAIMFLQDLGKLDHFAKLLAHKGYYQGWPESYLEVLFDGRTDPRT
jgi:hypothetical protein